MMNPFTKTFITDENFKFNDSARGFLKLVDKESGLKFLTSLQQDQSMCFLFQKKHTSLRDKAFNVKMNLSLDSRPPLKFINTNYFNYFQETREMENIDSFAFQNRL